MAEGIAKTLDRDSGLDRGLAHGHDHRESLWCSQ